MKRNLFAPIILFLVVPFLAGCPAFVPVVLSVAGSAGGTVGSEALKRKVFSNDETPHLSPIDCIPPVHPLNPVVTAEEAAKMQGKMVYHGLGVKEAKSSEKIGAIDNGNKIPVRVKKARNGRDVWSWEIMDACQRILDDVREGDVYFVTTIDGKPVETFQYRVPKKQ